MTKQPVTNPDPVGLGDHEIRRSSDSGVEEDEDTGVPVGAPPERAAIDRATTDNPGEEDLLVRDVGPVGQCRHRVLRGTSPTASKTLADQITTCDHSNVEYQPFGVDGEFHGWLIRNRKTRLRKCAGASTLRDSGSAGPVTVVTVNECW